MTPAQISCAANILALPAWTLLAVLPRRRWVISVVSGVAVPAVFARAYVIIIASQWGSRGGGFSTLEAVAALFSNRWLLLAGCGCCTTLCAVPWDRRARSLRVNP